MFTADPSVSVMKCRTLSPLSHLRFLLPLCSQFQLCTISVSCHFDFHHLFVGLLEHSPSLCCTVTTFTVFVQPPPCLCIICSNFICAQLFPLPRINSCMMIKIFFFDWCLLLYCRTSFPNLFWKITWVWWTRHGHRQWTQRSRDTVPTTCLPWPTRLDGATGTASSTSMKRCPRQCR